jgi:hypothetical protein
MMGNLVHTRLGSSYLPSHVLHCPPPPKGLNDPVSLYQALGAYDFERLLQVDDIEIDSLVERHGLSLIAG